LKKSVAQPALEKKKKKGGTAPRGRRETSTVPSAMREEGKTSKKIPKSFPPIKKIA